MPGSVYSHADENTTSKEEECSKEEAETKTTGLLAGLIVTGGCLYAIKMAAEKSEMQSQAEIALASILQDSESLEFVRDAQSKLNILKKYFESYKKSENLKIIGGKNTAHVAAKLAKDHPDLSMSLFDLYAQHTTAEHALFQNDFGGETPTHILGEGLRSYCTRSGSDLSNDCNNIKKVLRFLRESSYEVPSILTAQPPEQTESEAY